MKLALLLSLLAGTVQAERPGQSLESEALGGGRFRYTVRTFADPFFNYFNAVGFSVAADGVATGPGTDWRTQTPDVFGHGWRYEQSWQSPLARPHTARFEVQSALPAWRRERGAIVYSSLSMRRFHGNTLTGNVAGYWYADVLVPSAESDGSGPCLSVPCPALTLPQPVIAELVRIEGVPSGIRFDYPGPSTVAIEYAETFGDWRTLTAIHGNTGITTWMHTAPLPGSFFRVRLIDEGHAPLP